MRNWYSAKDLAGLKGVPQSVRGVQMRAKRESWTSRHCKGQGGGLEYHLDSLPENTVTALRCKKESLPVPACTDLVATEEVKVDLNSLKKWQRDIFEARLALYREFERLLALYGYSKAVAKLVLAAKTGTLPPILQAMVPKANARKGKSRTLSASMVKGWHRNVKNSGLTALAPKPARKDRVPPWASYFHKVYNRPQKPSLSEALRELETILPEEIPLPSYHQVRRYHKNRSRLEREKGRHSASALKRFRGYIRRSTDNLLPLDVVQCDGHSFKAKVAHPVHGRPFKPECCAVIDVKTRMILGYSTGLAESAHTVADALRHAMTVNDAKPWGGVPAILYTDKGAGNMAKMLGDEVTGVLVRAGVSHKTGIPGNAQGRGMIEKTNQQLWIAAAKKLDTFVGKDMDALALRTVYLNHEKEVKKTGTCVLSDLPSWPQFLEICNQAMRDFNNKPHSGLSKIRDAATGRIRHMTPAEAWFTEIKNGWKPTLLPPAILEDLFRPQIIRKTTRAKVELFNNIYYEPMLEHYHGEQVIVEYDIHDVHAVRVRDLEQRLLCVAQLDRNKKDFMPIPFVEQKRIERGKGRLALIGRKRDEIEAEMNGTMLESDASPLLIEADPGAVKRQLPQKNGQNIQMIEHAPIENIDFVIAKKESQLRMEEAAKPVKKSKKIQQMLTSESEQFNRLLSELRTDPRPLTTEECRWLNSYYMDDGGRMYLSMIGDLRQIYGVAEEGSEAAL